MRKYNTTELRQQNLKRVLDSIRKKPSITRGELTRSLDISFSTVSMLVKELVDRDVVRFSGEKTDSGGRRSDQLVLHKEARYILSINLAKPVRPEFALIDLAGNLLDHLSASEECQSLGMLVDTCSESLVRLLDKQAVRSSAVIGVGAAVPGKIDRESGLVIGSTDPLLENVALARLLQQRLEWPIYLENDANAAAISLSVREAKDNAVLIYVGEGLGVGMLLNGSPYRGAHGMASELAHLPLGEATCMKGHPGCLEGTLSRQGFLNLWADVSGKRDVSWTEFLVAVERHDPVILQLLKKAGHVLGQLLSGLINLIDPDTVYVGGCIEPFYEELMSQALEVMNERSLFQAFRSTPVVLVSDIERHILLGAGERVYQNWFPN